MNPNIISLGEVLWDLFPEGARFGGAPANFACHSAALGANVTLVSAVGDDARGREAIEILGRYGIDTSLIQLLPGIPTGAVGIELDENGKPAFTIHEGAAWDRLAWTSEIEKRIHPADTVYFGTLSQRDEAARETIRQALSIASGAGVSRVLDVNLRPPFFDDDLIRESVERASILKLSDDELNDVCRACRVSMTGSTEDSLRSLLDTCRLNLVVMTRGAEGAILVSPDEVVDHPGIPVTVRDTVGAGDSFTAAFVLGLLRGDPRDRILRDACELAAKVCSQPGAVPDPIQPST